MIIVIKMKILALYIFVKFQFELDFDLSRYKRLPASDKPRLGTHNLSHVSMRATAEKVVTTNRKSNSFINQ